MPPPLNLTRQKFGRLTAIKFSGYRRRGSQLLRTWECICECDGKKILVTAVDLCSGHVKSCGCLHHGHTRNEKRSPTYSSWGAMRQRCLNPRHVAFNRYAGRGITITERWNKFAAFLEDMGERPVGTTLERKNNDFGYFKENCKWAPRDEQNQNTRSNKLTFNQASEIALRALRGETHQSIAADFKLSPTSVTSIANGQTWKRAFKQAKLQFQLTGAVRTRGKFRKLTFADAVEIAKRRLRGEYGRTIALDYGVSIGLVHFISQGRAWKAALEAAKKEVGNA